MDLVFEYIVCWSTPWSVLSCRPCDLTVSPEFVFSVKHKGRGQENKLFV